MLLAQLPAGQGLADDADMTRTLLGQGWTYMEAGSLRQAEEAFTAAFDTPTGRNTAQVYYAIAAVWWERRNAMASYMWLSDAYKASRDSYTWQGGEDQEWDRRIGSRRRYIENHFTVVKLRAPRRGRPLPPLADPLPGDPLLLEFVQRLPRVVDEGVEAGVAVQWVLLPNGTYWIGDDLILLDSGELDPSRAESWNLPRDGGKVRRNYDERAAVLASGGSMARELLETQSDAQAALDQEREAREAAERQAAEERDREAAERQAAEDREREAADRQAAEERDREEREAAERQAALDRDREEREAAERQAALDRDREEREAADRQAAEERDREEREAADRQAALDRQRADDEARERELAELRAQDEARAEEERLRREAEEDERVRAAQEADEAARLAEEERRKAEWDEAEALRKEEERAARRAERDQRRADRADGSAERSGDGDLENFRARKLYLAAGVGGASVTRLTADGTEAELEWTGNGELGFVVPIKDRGIGMGIGVSYTNLPVSGCSQRQTRSSALALVLGPRIPVHIKGRAWLSIRAGLHGGVSATWPGEDVRQQCAEEGLADSEAGVAYGVRLTEGEATRRVSYASLGWRGYSVILGPDLELSVLVGAGAAPVYVGGGLFLRYDQVFALVHGDTYRFRDENTDSLLLQSQSVASFGGTASMARFQFGLRGMVMF